MSGFFSYFSRKNKHPIVFYATIDRTLEKVIDRNGLLYAMRVNGKRVATITGKFETKTQFHIIKIKNLANDNKGMFLYFPQIYATMEADLREQGVTRLVMLCHKKLVNTVETKYGFSVPPEYAIPMERHPWFYTKHGITLEKKLV